MGSSSSGWYRGRRTTVEDGITLSLSALKRLGLLEHGKSGMVTWNQAGRTVAMVGVITDLREDSAAVHLIMKRKDGSDWRQTIRLVSTVPTFGGMKWWLVCPRTGKRCRVVHWPPGASRFASREAYGLGYRSSQTCSASHRKRLAMLAAACGVTYDDVRRALRSKPA